jgi:membrane-bound lytic murein transglycosylase A
MLKKWATFSPKAMVIGSAISLPVVLLILFLPLKPVGKEQLKLMECWTKLQNNTLSAIAKNSPIIEDSQKPDIAKGNAAKKDVIKRKRKIPLVPISMSPFMCCQGKSACQDGQLWGEYGIPGDKQALLNSISQSLKYLQSEAAVNAYKDYRVQSITRDRVIRSLQRFRQLVMAAKNPRELQQAVEKEFQFYQSVGSDRLGGVLYTAYYEPMYEASKVATPEFRYPIYRRPPDLDFWPRPHPTRTELEGVDGLQADKGKLKGLEFFWFRQRFEPFMIQIQGSARLKLTDGTETTVGYAGNTRQDYVSIGKALADDGKLPLDGLRMPDIIKYFENHPEELNTYIPRDPSFVFFKENFGAPAMGSISVPVTADRSIATDKSVMPPGALAMIHSKMPLAKQDGSLHYPIITRFVLDQDTGGAIRGAGRVDYFAGTGKIAGDRAGMTASNGKLFYLLLKDNLQKK